MTNSVNIAENLRNQDGSDVGQVNKQPGVSYRSASPAKRSASERDDEMSSPKLQMADVETVQSTTNVPSATQSTPSTPLPDRPKSIPHAASLQSGAAEEGAIGGSRLVSLSDDTASSGQDTIMSSGSPSTHSTSTSLETNAVEQDQQGKHEHSVKQLDSQVEEITRLFQGQYVNPKEGAKGFVISSRWLVRVTSRTSKGIHEGHPKSAREGPIGPVDNSDLLLPTSVVDPDLRDMEDKPFTPLRPGLRMTEDIEIIPEEAWLKIVEWYGLAPGANNVITRYLHNTTPEGSTVDNYQFELYPTVFTIQRLQQPVGGVSQDDTSRQNAKAIRIVSSRSDYFQAFLKKIKAASGIEMSSKVQVWKVIETLQAIQARSTIPTPVSSRDPSPMPHAIVSREPPRLYVDINAFSSLEEGRGHELLDLKDETMNEKYNGHLTLDSIGFPDTQTLILEEQIGGPAGGEYASDNVRKIKGSSVYTSKSGHLTIAGQKIEPSSGRNSPSPSGMVTRGRARKDGRTKGCTGLTNLGNTCYMNSALQCIRSVEELALYFLYDAYKEDINANNPLGYGGAIAKAYAGFLSQVYSDGSTSFAPRPFKAMLGRCQPLFSGYGQQDSQEFLSFLVDGLHEDLNRVLKKPYMENPESDDETVHDPEAIRALGEKFRVNHLARNNSIAMDLFNGFYKNTMVCPTCDKVSITFDPYSLLTLQLPIENTWQHQITFAPLVGVPIHINVDIDKNSSIGMLKEYVAKRVPGLLANRLIVAEMYSHKFYKFFEDSVVLSEAAIQPHDLIVIYELDESPTNFPKKKPKAARSFHGLSHQDSDDDVPDFESPLADRMVIPLIHRHPHANGHGSAKAFGMWPSLILITREEAMDYDLILRKVLAKVDTMTTKSLFEDSDGEAGESEDQSEPLSDLGNGKENGSIIDGHQIQAKSVEGEDEFVDISMTGTGTVVTDQPQNATKRLLVPPPRKSKVLDPSYFYNPELSGAFNMCYYTGNNESVPTSFNAINENTVYPQLHSRVFEPRSRRSSAGSFVDASQEPAEQSESEDELSLAIPTSESFNPSPSPSETDTDEPNDRSLEQVPAFTFKQRKKPEHLRTLSNKDKKQAIVTPPTLVKEPLIRPGEGILLDWSADAFDSLFEGDDDDDQRGQDTSKLMELLPDPELEAKKARRASRKKSGVTLDECFEETAKSEILSEENAWYCGRCKELRRATKTLEIWTAPDILVVHLKRFSSTSRLRDKIDVLVDFPIEGLDLTGRVGLPGDKGLLYDLFAVDNHYGGLGGGHYTAYAQNFYDKKWYDYNDSSVSSIAPVRVVTPAAYLLFYRRRSDNPLGPPYLQKIVIDAQAIESGEGQRLDDPTSSHSGLSGAFQNREAEAAASHQPRSVIEDGDQIGAVRIAGVGGLAGASQSLVTIARSAIDPDDALPSYESFQDEGVAMDEDILPSYETGYAIEAPTVYGPNQPTWTFAGIPNDLADGATAPSGSPNSSVTLNDEEYAASDAPMAGSVDDLAERMVVDFGDDMDSNGSRPLSGFSQMQAMRHSPDADEDVPFQNFGEPVEHIVGVDPPGESEGEVVEVHVPSDDEAKQG